MFKNLLGVMASPLTKYMTIAIVVLVVTLGGSIYLSYKFYGQKEVAQAVTEQLEVAVETQTEQTGKALKSIELIDKKVAEVREAEKAISEATQKLQEEVSVTGTTTHTREVENETESPTEPCSDFLSDADIRLLQRAHCLTDGDASDCN